MNCGRKAFLFRRAEYAPFGCGNRLVTLDLRPCSERLKADAGGNPPLTTVYCRASQSVSADGHTEIIVR